MSTQLYRIIFPVDDIARAAQFYSDILEQEGQHVSPGRLYFNLGGTILACYDPIADGDDLGEGWRFHENQYIYLAVAELERLYDKVKHLNGEIIGEGIATMPWGERLFYMKDPFGNPVCFVDEATVFKG